jgi:hypothetical protein
MEEILKNENLYKLKNAENTIIIKKNENISKEK